MAKLFYIISSLTAEILMLKTMNIYIGNIAKRLCFQLVISVVEKLNLLHNVYIY